MKTAKKALSVFLCALMLSLCLVPAFAEEYAYTPESCPGHQYGTEGVVTAPTCTTDGYTEYTCVWCGYVNRADLTNRTGHELVTETVAPTCTESGYTRTTCTRCDYEAKSNFVSATGEHDWQVVSEQAATCGAAGYKREQCTVCKNFRYTDIPASGSHTWTKTGERAATCARSGEEYFTCSVCGADRAVEIKPTGDHKDTDGDGLCNECGVSVRAEGPSSGTTFMTVWNRLMDFFWNIIQKIQALFTK